MLKSVCCDIDVFTYRRKEGLRAGQEASSYSQHIDVIKFCMFDTCEQAQGSRDKSHEARE
jgi:hypothetical protein